MRENLVQTLKQCLTPKRLVPVAISAVLMTLITFSINATCSVLSTPLSSISSHIDRVTTRGSIALEIKPVQRQATAHEFLFWGHVHYITTYHIVVGNRGADADCVARLQISSQKGDLVTFSGPPITNPRFANGQQATDWSDKLDVKSPRTIAIDFEFPPIGVSVTFAVMVERTGGFVPDDDLRVFLKYDQVLVQDQANSVKWTSQMK